MKIIYQLSFLLPGVLVYSSSIAQESCKVSIASISGLYEGDCKKGKANGSGKAKGADQYEGEFKDGFPNGQGVYIWKNGNIYSGTWVSGKRHGQGDMTIKRNGRADSVVTGFWKKDEYFGKYEKPYQVYNRSVQVSKTEVKFQSSPINEIIVLLSNTTGNMPTMSGPITPKAALTDIVISKGSFLRLVDLYETNKQTAYKLEQVIYPFKAKFRIGSQQVEVEFLEGGQFTLDIGLNN